MSPGRNISCCSFTARIRSLWEGRCFQSCVSVRKDGVELSHGTPKSSPRSVQTVFIGKRAFGIRLKGLLVVGMFWMLALIF